MNLNKTKQYAIGIDIGGTNMKAVLFDGSKVIMDYKLATPQDTLEHFLIMACALIEPLLDQAKKDKMKIKGIGVSLAGVIDYQSRKMLTANNIPVINGIRVGDLLTVRLNIPTEIDHDANCFLRAEMKFGAGQKFTNVYGVIIGTGIGGAWWNNNEIYQGFRGGAGEIGEMIVDVENHLNIEQVYKKLTQNSPSVMAEEAYRGDVLAEKTFKEIGKYLGITFANMVNIIDPETIIIGGGFVESSDLFLSEAKKTTCEFIHSAESKKIKILKSKLGENAGAIGAALMIK